MKYVETISISKYIKNGHFEKVDINTRNDNLRSNWPEVFFKILQNSLENACARVSFLILKKRLWYKCFPVNFVKFLRTPIFIEHLWCLLLVFLHIHFSGKTRRGVYSYARGLKTKDFMFRSSHSEVFYKKVFLKILQNSQENICVAASFLTKLQASGFFY